MVVKMEHAKNHIHIRPHAHHLKTMYTSELHNGNHPYTIPLNHWKHSGPLNHITTHNGLTIITQTIEHNGWSKPLHLWLKPLYQVDVV
jgi:hypothetical protein